MTNSSRLPFTMSVAITCSIRTLIIAAAVQAAAPVVISAAEPHQAVTPYLEENTIVVAWTDLAHLHVDKTVTFMNRWGTATGSAPMAKSIRDALVKLGVTRVYWVSSLSGIMSGPEAAIVPCELQNVAAVRLVLQAAAGDGGIAEVDGHTVLAGNAKAVSALRQRSSEPSQELLRTLKETDGNHGIVLMTPSTVIRSLPALVSPATQGVNSPFAERFTKVVVNLRSLTLAGDIPPRHNRFSVTMNSLKAASQLADLLNEWTTVELADASAPLRAMAQDRQITWETSSEKDVDAVMDSLMQLAAPARERAEILSTKNSLKQIGSAFHAFHDAYGHFPPQALTDKDGKRLVSWRVLILPFLGYEELYNEFHLDEPWNSHHNSRLISEMPFPYRSAHRRNEANVTTTKMLAPLTENSAMGRPGPGLDIREVVDGTSHSLLVLEAGTGRDVVWTKPEDLRIDTENPVESIIDSSNKGFPAVMCDGSVNYFPASVDLLTFKALLSIDGEEVVDWDKLK